MLIAFVTTITYFTNVLLSHWASNLLLDFLKSGSAALEPTPKPPHPHLCSKRLLKKTTFLTPSLTVAGFHYIL